MTRTGLAHRLMPFAALWAASCGWNHLPNQQTQYLEEALWEPSGAVATSGALYVRLPYAGALVRLVPDLDPQLINIGEGRVTRIAAAPDGETVVAFLERYFCSPDDPKEADRIDIAEDCPADDLSVETEISLITGSDVDDGQPVDGAYNAIRFSDDGRFGIAYLDFAAGVQLNGVVNLTGVVVIDLQENASRLVTVGFAPDQVLFNYDAYGAATSAVVLSRNQVASVDLLADPIDVTRFPLTLDPDIERVPTGVALTPDGRYALISTEGSADLYAIDLDNESINIVDLESAPSTFGVNLAQDRTVLVYGNRPVAEVMEHRFFETDTFELDEGMNQVDTVGDSAILWSTDNRHDLYRLNLLDNVLTEYRLQNPAISLHVAPGADFAVALTRAEGSVGEGVDALYDNNPGMEIIDLTDDDTQPFVLEGEGLDVAFAADDTNLNAIVLQRGVDYLFRYNLYAQQSEEIELAAPPVTIGSLSNDGTFWITHDTALGLVSFLDPATGNITEVGGFASLAIVDPIELIKEER